MREILFRGECSDDGTWKFGAYGNHTSLDAMIIDRPYLTAGNDLAALGFWVVDPATVGQYTGLTDRNGVKIFEGDVALYDDDLVLVEWDEEDALFYIRSLDGTNWTADFSQIYGMDLEITGNIHDNPELLEAAP